MIIVMIIMIITLVIIVIVMKIMMIIMTIIIIIIIPPGMSPARSPGTGYRPSPTTASSMWQVSVATNKKELLLTTNYFCKNVQ